jgi:hypothetical protein
MNTTITAFSFLNEVAKEPFTPPKSVKGRNTAVPLVALSSFLNGSITPLLFRADYHNSKSNFQLVQAFQDADLVKLLVQHSSTIEWCTHIRIMFSAWNQTMNVPIAEALLTKLMSTRYSSRTLQYLVIEFSDSNQATKKSYFQFLTKHCQVVEHLSLYFSAFEFNLDAEVTLMNDEDFYFDLSLVKHLGGSLKKLNVECFCLIPNCESAISQLRSLEELNITAANCLTDDDLLGLKNLKNLSRLHLDAQRITGKHFEEVFKPLGGSLRKLTITNCEALENLKGIEQLQSLEHLELRVTPQGNSSGFSNNDEQQNFISPFSYFPNLKSCELTHIPIGKKATTDGLGGGGNLRFLSSSASLQLLSLVSCLGANGNELADLVPILQNSLTTLTVNTSDFLGPGNMKAISQMKRLVKVRFDGQPLKLQMSPNIADYPVWEGPKDTMEEIYFFDMQHMPLISFISPCSNTRILHCVSLPDAIHFAEGLKNMSCLTYLRFDSCPKLSPEEFHNVFIDERNIEVDETSGEINIVTKFPPRFPNLRTLYLSNLPLLAEEAFTLGTVLFSLPKIETLYLYIGPLRESFFNSLKQIETLENVFGYYQYSQYCENHRKYRASLKQEK